MKKALLPLAVVALCQLLAAALPETIVIPKAPTPVEKRAASELADYLQQITGRSFNVVTEADFTGNGKVFAVGNTAKAAKCFPKPFGYDGIGIMESDGDVVLNGHPRRGALYAVYTLLEKYAGVRWYSSTVTVVPKNPDLSFDKVNEVYTPPFMLRETHFTDAYVAPFAARLKNNGHFVKLPEDFGGNEKILGFCHTFDQILPPGKYFAQHPEWYSMLKGKRAIPRFHQLCLTNTEMRQEFVKNTLAWIEKNPGVRIISISQNDGPGYCECPECAKLAAAEGSQSGPILHFVNAVAEEIEKVHPEMLVDTLAYNYTRTAPKHVRPRRNVSIRYCDIEADFSNPLEAGKLNRPLSNDLLAWRKVSGKMLIWHYVNVFGNPITPFPSMNNYAKDIRFFLKNHAVGVFLEGDTFTNGLMDFSQLRVWVLAHLLWDPDADEKALVADFLNGYYGPAAPAIAKYLAFVEQCHRNTGDKLSCFDRKSTGFLGANALIKGSKLFDEALAAVAGKPEYEARVRFSRTSLDNAALQLYPYLRSIGKTGIFTEEKWKEMAEEISAASKTNLTARGYKVITLWNMDKRYLEMLSRPESAPACAAGLARDQYVDFQDYMFSLAGVGKLALPIDDPEASDGKAVRLVGGNAWALQQELLIPLKPGRKYKLAVSAKSDVRAHSNTAAMLIAIYDQDHNKELVRTVVKLKEMNRNGYAEYFTPEFVPTPRAFLYVSPLSSTADKGVVVDRVTLLEVK